MGMTAPLKLSSLPTSASLSQDGNKGIAPPIRISRHQVKATPERHGPCYLHVMALFDLVKRLDQDTKIKLGRLLSFCPNAWHTGREEAKHCADIAVRRNNGETIRSAHNPMSTWQKTMIDMQDLLWINHSPLELHNDSLIQNAERFLTDLAQALLIWDLCRPRVFRIFYDYLGRIAYQPPLIKNRAPMIVGIWIIRRPHHEDIATGLIGGKDIEEGRARIKIIKAINDRYQEREERGKPKADPP